MRLHFKLRHKLVKERRFHEVISLPRLRLEFFLSNKRLECYIHFVDKQELCFFVRYVYDIARPKRSFVLITYSFGIYANHCH